MRCRLAALALALTLIALPTRGDEAAPRLRIGSSGDYPPFSVAEADGRWSGLDVAVARAYAEDRGLEVEIVRFSWRRLARDLEAGRFDAAFSGVTIRPDRSAGGRFSIPVLETGAVVLVNDASRWRKLEDLDRPVARIAVHAGGFLEPVARRRFPRATLLAIPDNGSVLEALRSYAVDAAVSERFEADLWQPQLIQSTRFGPFTRDRKAYWIRPDRPELAADLDAWLMEREADGSLAGLRRQHLPGAPGEPLARPLTALVAALDERLALMPLVAAAKREQGYPLAVPEREAAVIETALAGVVAAAERSGRTAPKPTRVRSLFRAQIEAAKQIQVAAVRDDEREPEGPLPDVERVLRPALDRIGAKIAALLVALPEGRDAELVRAAARAGLRAPYLDERRREALVEALAAL